MRLHRPLVALALSGSLLLVAAACGDDDGGSGSAAPTTTVASGGTETSQEGLPVVTGSMDEKPTIEIPTTDPPATLQVKVLEEGTGPEVVAGDTVNAQYVGVIWRDGSQFDASWDRGQPATFPVGTGNLIAGWDEGLVGIPYGSRVLLVIPPDKGYGASGNPAAGILGTDTLVFVVDLVSKAG